MNEIYEMVLRNVYTFICSKENFESKFPESIFDFAPLMSIMFAKTQGGIIEDYLVVNKILEKPENKNNEKV